MDSLLKAMASAAGNYVPMPATAADFLSSHIFLWVFLNVIVIWLYFFSSSSCGTSSSAGNDGEVVVDPVPVDRLYSSLDYEAFSDVDHGRRARAEAQASKRLAREARAARRADRPRVRKKPAAGEEEPGPWAAVAEACRSTGGGKRGEETLAVTAAAAGAKVVDDDDSIDSMWQAILRRRAAEAGRPDVRKRSEATPAVAVAVAAAAAAAAEAKANDPNDDDETIDSTWQAIVQRRAARPVAVRKSESWGNDEVPRLQRVAETAAVAPREMMRKSVSAVNKAAAPSAARQLGWRMRDALMIAPEELLRRAESLIRRHHESLRLQRQESEQRQARLHAPPLIRV